MSRPNGPVWVSSQLAKIEVAAPFVTFAMERTASEQGKDTELFCKVQQVAAFDQWDRTVGAGKAHK